jgi:hypothetical protein
VKEVSLIVQEFYNRCKPVVFDPLNPQSWGILFDQGRENAPEENVKNVGVEGYAIMRMILKIGRADFWKIWN